MLSDRTIRSLLRSGAVEIKYPDHPYRELDDSQIQPVSIDLLLGSLDQQGDWNSQFREGDDPWVWRIAADGFILGSTAERVCLPNFIAGEVVGKSSWARRGLLIEAAGLVDPGFDGQLTLEIKNLRSESIELPLMIPICQLVLYTVDQPVERPYGSEGLGSHYQGQRGPTPACEL